MKSIPTLVAENDARAVALTKAAIAKPTRAADVCIVCEIGLTHQALGLDDEKRCRHCGTEYREGLIDDETERRAEAADDRRRVREEREDS